MPKHLKEKITFLLGKWGCAFLQEDHLGAPFPALRTRADTRAPAKQSVSHSHCVVGLHLSAAVAAPVAIRTGCYSH